MRRLSIDIGGTFTDCFLEWDGRHIEAKALTTHHNLAVGFLEAVGRASQDVTLPAEDVLAGVDSVRYGTTLGTNALIERKGPRIGVLVTMGFESGLRLSRGRGYGEIPGEIGKLEREHQSLRGGLTRTRDAFIEHVELRRPTRHEQHDDMLRFRREIRKLGSRGRRRLRVASQHACQPDRAEAAAKRFHPTPSRNRFHHGQKMNSLVASRAWASLASVLSRK